MTPGISEARPLFSQPLSGPFFTTLPMSKYSCSPTFDVDRRSITSAGEHFNHRVAQSHRLSFDPVRPDPAPLDPTDASPAQARRHQPGLGVEVSAGAHRSGDRGRPRGEFGSPVRLRRASTSSGFGPASRHLHLRRTAGAMQVSTPDWAGALSGLPPGGARRGVETEGVPALGAL